MQLSLKQVIVSNTKYRDTWYFPINNNCTFCAVPHLGF